MGKRLAVLLFLAGCVQIASADMSEIKVDLRLGGTDFVVGERVRGIVDIANSSPDKIVVGAAGSRDRCLVEIFRSSDMKQLSRISDAPFVASFTLESGEGQKLETFLGDHYALQESNRYLARAVLVHKGIRYEGQFRAFDIVDGVRLASALQMFKHHDGLQREFEAVYWSRKDGEHLFLKAKDAGTGNRRWETRDLGPILRLDKPTVSILPTGEVVVLHRLNQDQFIRSEFWSLPKALEFRVRETVRDPATAATSRVREMYKDGGVKPKTNPWWKFW